MMRQGFDCPGGGGGKSSLAQAGLERQGSPRGGEGVGMGGFVLAGIESREQAGTRSSDKRREIP